MKTTKPASGRKPGPGRHKLPEGEAKGVQIALRVTEEDRQELIAAAAKDKRTLANFIRWASLGVARGEF